MNGVNIVFTGALSEGRNAHAVKVKAVGANYVSAVSEKTDYLIVRAKPGKVKLAAAEKFFVKIINEELWKEIMETL